MDMDEQGSGFLGLNLPEVELLFFMRARLPILISSNYKLFYRLVKPNP